MKYNIVYYYPEWAIYDRNYPVCNIPIEYTPEIAYAFFDLKPNQQGYYVPTCIDKWAAIEKRYTESGVYPLDTWNDNNPYYGNLGQFRKLKESGKKFQLGLSIGGWTGSAHFSTAVASDASRSAFVSELVSILHSYGIFDSVNIDWEFISPPNEPYGLAGNAVSVKDPQNFCLLLQLIKDSFRKNGLGHVKLSAAVTGCPNRTTVLPIEGMTPLLDEFHLMTYDYASSAWGKTLAGHHSNLKKTAYTPYSVEESVNAYLARGVPASKIYIGVAFYSRGFANTLGIGQPSFGITTLKSWEEGVCDYKHLPPPGSFEHWDESAQASFCYDPLKKELLSYDSIQSVIAKCKFVKEKGLKGILVWEITGDRSIQNEGSLVKALFNNLMK